MIFCASKFGLLTHFGGRLCECFVPALIDGVTELLFRTTAHYPPPGANKNINKYFIVYLNRVFLNYLRTRNVKIELLARVLASCRNAAAILNF